MECGILKGEFQILWTYDRTQMDSGWNMKGAYGLKRQSKCNMNGMWDFGHTIMDFMDLEQNINVL